ncbi:cytochrome c oxidase accessory protein CcoG [Gammaproteobacteria bacterium 42_54_T18]|nr:cytochrome c oxidase accessory protein CcoG [Gammaproteobacteria bacterium 42_54_T18]
MPERIFTTTLDANTNKIYTRRTQGFYQQLRRYTGIPLLLSYGLIPWLNINGRPAVLFDLTAQKFHILWMSFWPQDGILLAALLILAAFLLFIATILVGRVWCGFTCPQTVWTMMFMWAENLCEGDRNQRIKLDHQPWSLNKLLRKGGKHSIWLLISLITGFSFVAYFYPVRELLTDVIYLEASAATYFWVLFFVGFTYLNAGWLRESVCKHMCPYARFQSAMYDKDTMVVTYDSKRGDPRGGQKGRGEQKGDCVDCSWCVQVCPVDIDIRDGLQYACIDCGLCVDACNNVMDKVGYSRGLIRFTSQHAMETGHTQLLRPRLVAYIISAVIMSGLFFFTVATRSPVSLDVVRDRGTRLFHTVHNGVENVYTIKINNMGTVDQTFTLSVEGRHHYILKGHHQATVRPGEVYVMPTRVWRAQEEQSRPQDTLEFVVKSTTNPDISARQKASFIAQAKIASNAR